jgi:ubiquitin C-terminal hydrolase
VPPTLFSALCHFCVHFQETADKGAVSPRALIDRLRDENEHFHGVMYQDVHEFLNYLLNEIVEEIQYDKYYKHKDKDKDNSSFQDVPQGLRVSGTPVDL